MSRRSSGGSLVAIRHSVFGTKGGRWPFTGARCTSSASASRRLLETPRVNSRRPTGFPGTFTAALLLLAAVLVSTPSGAALSWYEQALLASGALPSERLATCVAVRGDLAVVGIPGRTVANQPEVGTLEVFARRGTAWSLVQTLTTPPPFERASAFGASCAMSDERLVVGALGLAIGGASAPGAAYVYLRSGTAFVLEQKLVASDAAPADQFGTTVAIDVDTVVVGEVHRNAALDGAAYVFARAGTSWSFVQRISPTDVADVARSLALDGATLAVGAFDFAANHGVVRTYERAGATFAPAQSLTAGVPGVEDNFGRSLVLAGDLLVVGDSIAPSRGGRALVYRRNAGPWTLSTTLAPPALATEDAFGQALAMAGNALFVGTPNRAGGGSVFLFERAGATWSAGRELAAKGVAHAQLGATLAVSNDVLLAGAPQSSGATGAAYVFRRGLGPGDSCTDAASCVSGFCVDAVCCNEACGGGAAGDCQACSLAAGAAGDGTCGPTAATIVCRTAASICDVAEHCDGVTTACPTDGVVVNGIACPGGTCLGGRCATTSADGPDAAASEAPAPSPSGCGCHVAGQDAARTSGARLPLVAALALSLAFIVLRRKLRGPRAARPIVAILAGAASSLALLGSARAGGPAWQEESHLIPSPQGNSQAGEAIAVRGDVAAVGASSQDVTGPGGLVVNAGSVFVYARKGGSWVLAQTIAPPVLAPDTPFGLACAVGDGRLVIAQPSNLGAVYVYKLAGTTWQVEQKLVPTDPVGGEEFGSKVAIFGDTIVVGAPLQDGGKGAVYTFNRGTTGWSPGPTLTASGGVAGDFFGQKLAFDGTTLVVASPSGPGALYAYPKNASGFGAPQVLAASGPSTPQDHFGTAIAVLGDLLVATKQGATKPGGAFVFHRVAGVWTEQTTLLPPAVIANDRYGDGLAIAGTTIFVGASRHAGRGSVFEFRPSGATFALSAEHVASDRGAMPSFFGARLATSGDTLFVGAPGRTDQAGEAYAFRLALAAGDPCATNASCLSGFCVDGVCCNEACGGNSATDCAVCSRAAGAKEDGVCGPAPTTLECRAAASTCDFAERCDGRTLTCPADAVATNGESCAEGVCLGGRCAAPGALDGGADAGPGGPIDEASASSGCGCRVTSRTRLGAMGLAVLALLLCARVRRASRRSQP